MADLKRTLVAVHADPSRLMVEVAEATLDERPDAALAIVRRMANCGVRVALDNFGSGLAALNQLARMPVDTVKIDPVLTVAAFTNRRQLAPCSSH